MRNFIFSTWIICSTGLTALAGPPPGSREHKTPAVSPFVGEFTDATSGDKIVVKKVGSYSSTDLSTHERYIYNYKYQASYFCKSTGRTYRLDLRSGADERNRDTAMLQLAGDGIPIMRMKHSKALAAEIVTNGINVKWAETSLPDLRDKVLFFKRRG